MAGRHHQPDPIGDLIGQLYDAALDPALWPSVAPGIATALDSPSTALVVQERGELVPGWLSRTANLTDAAAREYEAHYHKFDVWVNGAARKGMSQILVGQEVISDAELLRTEFFNDWCRKVENFHCIGSVFDISDGAIAMLGVHRPQDGRPYAARDRLAAGRVLLHLRRALQVRQRLSIAGIERQAALDALERTGVATLVVGRDGRILYASVEAEKLLREGSVIQSRNGKLTAAAPAMATRLAQLIHDAVDTAASRGVSTGGALKLDRDDRLPLTFLAAPFRPAKEGFGSPIPAALVFIRDPERPTATTTALQGLFGLTAAEASIAVDLSRGESMADVTREHRISINTAKTHLKAILVKTGTSRQGELVALVLRSVAVLDCE